MEHVNSLQRVLTNEYVTIMFLSEQIKENIVTSLNL